MFMAAQHDYPTIIGWGETTKLSDPVTAWCMIQARPGWEQEGRDYLRRMGIGVYWPNYPKYGTVRDRRTGHRRSRSQLAGVFPGVMFSPARLTHHFWNAIDLAPGVFNLARKTDTTLVILNDLDIVIIHKIEEGLNKSLPTKPVHNLKIGEKIKFLDDDLSRWGQGRVNRLLQDGRISVEIPLMGRLTAVIVLPSQVGRC